MYCLPQFAPWGIIARAVFIQLWEMLSDSALIIGSRPVALGIITETIIQLVSCSECQLRYWY
jgi:hypothetical protein